MRRRSEGALIRSRLPIGDGEVSASIGWRRLSENALIKEHDAQIASLSMNRSLAPPRLQINFLATDPAPADDPAQHLLALFEAMRAGSDGIALQRLGSFAFDDAATGAEMCLAVEPLPGMRALQLHVARVAEGRLVHILGNAPVTAGPEALDELTAIIKSFRSLR
jgi:hypothetical protein